MKAKFIVAEGMDFSGKTTTLRLLSKILTSRNIPHILTREPGGSGVAEQIRSILLSEPSISETEQAMLFQTARSHHSRTFIKPNLENGIWVLSDRYIISSMVYQNSQVDFFKRSARELDLAEPDVLLFTTCGEDETLRRKSSRDEVNHLDETFTKHYRLYSDRFNHFASKLGDAAYIINTSSNGDDVEVKLNALVDNLLAS